MEKVKFKDIFSFEKKSKIKAGDGFKLGEGKYPFYTSSDTLSKTLNDFLFEKESLIFGTGGLASIHHCNDKFAVSTDCFVTQPKVLKSVYAKYVYFYLSGNMHLLENGFKGAGLKHISKGYIEDLEIPLPSLQTQQKIAAILDKADELCQYNKQLIEKYDALTQSLFLDMFGDPVRNEKKWEIVPLKHFINKLNTGVSVNSEDTSNKKGQYLILKTSCVYSGIFNSKQVKTIREDEIQRAKLNPKKDSIIISRMNTSELVGKSAFIHEDFPNIFLPDRLWQTEKTNIEHSVLWLSYNIGHSSFMNEISKISSGTSGSMKNISKSSFLELKSIKPPITVQNQFEERVKLIEFQKQQAQEALAKSELLFQGLLQQAFIGELN
jgi:type I restriction enzyme S subunit